jgi:hypothetical protein
MLALLSFLWFEELSLTHPELLVSLNPVSCVCMHVQARCTSTMT